MPYKDPEVRRQKNKEYSKQYYLKNKDECIVRNKLFKILAKKRWQEFKATLKCINCGFNHPATLDFHHVIRKPENKKIHALVQNSSYAKAVEEIKKCVVLCANCHRIHHNDEHLHKKATLSARKRKAHPRKS